MDLHQFLPTKFRGFGSCKEAKIMWQSSVLQCFGAFCWKGILEFLTIPFQLLTLFGIKLLIWHPFGALHMVCLMVFL